MVPKICSIPECGRVRYARGWCKVHYYRVQRTGVAGPAGPIQPKKYLPCVVVECTNLIGSKGGRGYCTKHYQMWRLTGDPCGSTAPTAEQRFWEKVVKTPTCWIWIKSTDDCGYGMFSDLQTHRAHRWSYENLIGPIPAGLVLDHLCRNTRCVNPAHLEPVTNDENLERGWGRRVKNGWVNHCIHGHEFTLENTYINGQGRKVCRTCSAVSREKYTQRKALSNG